MAAMALPQEMDVQPLVRVVDHPIRALIEAPDRPPPTGDRPFVVQIVAAVVGQADGQRLGRWRPVGQFPGPKRIPHFQHQVAMARTRETGRRFVKQDDKPRHDRHPTGSRGQAAISHGRPL
jgi:hypothetical protein